MKTDKASIEKLRRNLPTIRNIAGWSAERLAELLDVSRATVVTLENTENKMSVMQYLAIRKLLDEEIKDGTNQQLARAVEFLIDCDDIPEIAKAKFREETAQVVRKIGRKAGSAAVSKALGEAVSKALGEMELRDIPQESIERGKAILDDLLSIPASSKSGKPKGGDKNE